MALLQLCSLLLLSLLVVLSNASVYTPAGQSPASLHAGLVLGANPNYIYAPCGDSVCSFNSNGQLVQTVNLPAPTSQLVVDGFHSLLYAVLDTQESSAVLSCDGASLSLQTTSPAFASKGTLAVVGANTFWANASGVYSFTTKSSSLVLASQLALSGESSVLAYSRRSLFVFKANALHIISTALEAISEFKFQGQAKAVEFSSNGETLYIATSTSIYIVDVSNLRNPVQRNIIAVSATSLVVDGKYLLVGTESDGVSIYDVSSPRKSLHVANVMVGKNERVSGMIVRSNKLYVATQEGLYLFSSASTSAHKATARSSRGRATRAVNGSTCTTQQVSRRNGATTHDFDRTGMSSDGNRYLHVDYNGTLNIRDATSSSLSLINTYSLGSDTMNGAFAWDTARNLLFYRMAPSTSVFILDYTNAMAPKIRAEIQTNATGSNQPKLVIAGTVLYYGFYANSGGQVLAYQTSDPTNPVALGQTSFSVLTFNNWFGFTSSHIYAAAAFQAFPIATVQVYNIKANPLTPTLVANYSLPSGNSLSVSGASADGNLLYVTVDSAIVHVLSLANPTAPTVVASLNVSNFVQSVLKVNDKYWVASYSAGVLVFDQSGAFLTQNNVDAVNPSQQQPVIAMTANNNYVFASIYPSVIVYSAQCSNGSSSSSTTSFFTTTTGSKNSTTTQGLTSSTTGSFSNNTGTTGIFNSTLTSSTSASSTTFSPIGTTSTGFSGTTTGSGSTTGSGNGGYTPGCTTQLIFQRNTNSDEFATMHSTKAVLVQYVANLTALAFRNAGPTFNFTRSFNLTGSPVSWTFDTNSDLFIYYDFTPGAHAIRIVNYRNITNVFQAGSLDVSSLGISKGYQIILRATGYNGLIFWYSQAGVDSWTKVYDISTPSAIDHYGDSFNYTYDAIVSGIFSNGYFYTRSILHPVFPTSINVFDVRFSNMVSPVLLASVPVTNAGIPFVVIGLSQDSTTLWVRAPNGANYTLSAYLIGTVPGQVNVKNLYNLEFDDYFTSIIDTGKLLWVGTGNSGVFVYDTTNQQRVKLLTINSVPINQLPSPIPMQATVGTLLATFNTLFVFTPNHIQSHRLNCTNEGGSTGPFTTSGSFGTTSTIGKPTTGGISSTTGPVSGTTTGGGETFRCITPLLQQIGMQGEYRNSYLIADGTKILRIVNNVATVEQVNAPPSQSYAFVSQRNISASYPSDIKYDSTSNMLAVADNTIKSIILYSINVDGELSPVSYVKYPNYAQVNIAFGRNTIYAQWWNYSQATNMNIQVTAAFNISDLSSPSLLGYANFSGSIQNAQFINGYAYVSSNGFVNVISLANPLMPKVVASLTLSPSGNYIFLTPDTRNKNIIYGMSSSGESTQIFAINIQNPEKLFVANSFIANAYVNTALSTNNGTYLWLGTYQNGVWVVDMSAPVPSVITKNALPWVVPGAQMQPAELLLTTGNTVLAPTYAGLFVFSTICSDNKATTTTGIPATTGGSKPSTSTSTGGMMGTTTGQTGTTTGSTEILPCTNPLLQQIGSKGEYTNSWLIANGTRILRIVSPNVAVVEQILAPPSQSYAFVSQRNITQYAYPSDIKYDPTSNMLAVADPSIKTIILYSINVDGELSPVSYVQYPNYAFQVSIAFGLNTIYAQWWNYSQATGMNIQVTAAFSISDLSSPSLLGFANITGSLQNALFINGYAYTTNSGTINVFSLASPLNPKVVASLTLGENYAQLTPDTRNRNRIYALVGADMGTQIFIINIQNPEKLFSVGSYISNEMPNTAISTNNGAQLWIGTYMKGVWVVDMTLPVPRVIAKNPVGWVVQGSQMQPISTLMAIGDTVMAPTYTGLYVFSTICVNGTAGTTGFPSNGTTGFPGNASTGAATTARPTTMAGTTGKPSTTGGSTTGGRVCTETTCEPGYQCYVSSPTVATCIYWFVASPFSCNADSGNYASFYATGGAGPYNYTFDQAQLAPTTGYQTVKVLPPGNHVLGVRDSFGNLFTFPFYIYCDWCRQVNCPYCISGNGTFACINIQNSVQPCAANGSISMSYFGNGLTDLVYSLDGAPATSNPNFTSVSSGIHFVTVSSAGTPGGSSVKLNTTIFSSTCGSYVYLGCFQDNYPAARDLTFGPYYSADFASMSAPVCVQKCLAVGPYKYAGLQSGNQCWCGNSYGKFSGVLPETTCNTRCGGSGPTTYCGGNNVNSIYDTGINVDYCQSQPCGSLATCMNRVGTFSCVLPSVSYDQCTGAATLTVNVTGTGSFSYKLNNGTTSSSPSFAVGAGKYFITVSDSFGYNVTVATSVEPRAPFNINSTEWKYVGCFVENPAARDLPVGPFTSKNMTAQACANYCRVGGYVFMGLQNGAECWCGNSYGSSGPAISGDAACNSVCGGNPCRMCGGYKLNSIYNIGDACNPNPCNGTEKCLLSGNNYACVAASLVQSKCSNTDGYIQLSARGSDTSVQWSLNNGLFTKVSEPFQLIGLNTGANKVAVQNGAGSSASFNFNVTALAVRVLTAPLPCQPNVLITPVFNRPYNYSSTLKGADGIFYNYTDGSYTVPTAQAYTFKADCDLSAVVTLPTPSLPGAPGLVSASLNLATNKITVSFDPPASLTIAVSNYILSVSTDGGATARKIPIAGSGSEIAYVYGTTYHFAAQAQTCDGLGDRSNFTSFLAAVPPSAPTISGTISSNGTTATGSVQWFVSSIVLGDSLYYEVECNSGSGYSRCANTTAKSASLLLALSTTYTIRVRAVNVAGQSGPYSNEINLFFGTPCSTPAAPTSSGMDYVSRAITVSWSSVGSCTYNLETLSGSAWKAVVSGQSQTFWTSTATLLEDSTYSYRVIACNTYGCSSPSPALNVLASAAPLAPANVALKSQIVSLTTANATIAWTQNIPSSSKATIAFTYTIQVSYDAAAWTNATTVTANSPSGAQSVSGMVTVNQDVKVYVRVIAQNANGYSQPSNVLDFTIASPPKGTPLINTIVPASVTQFGQITITITGLNINANSKSQCVFTSISGTVIVNATGILGSDTINCITPQYPVDIFDVTPGAWQVTVTSDGIKYSAAVGLTVTPKPYVSYASPVWIDSRGSYYYLDGNYFDACKATYLVFGAGVLSGTFIQGASKQSLEYILPAGSVYSPITNVQFFCDSILIYTGIVAYYDSTLVSTIAATTWSMASVGDESVTIPGNWANYAANSKSLPAPQVRLSNKPQYSTYGYFYSSAAWNGNNMVLTEVALPFSPSNAANNLFDVEISVDDGATWYFVTKTGSQITVSSPNFAATCASLSCSACSAATACTWFSKNDGRGWCSSTPAKISANPLSYTQVGTTCDVSGISETFNPSPIAAQFTDIDANNVQLTVTLAFTFTQSSESAVTKIANIGYNIYALDSAAKGDVQITATPSYSYFTNYAASNTIQLQFSGKVAKSDLSGSFQVDITYSDSDDYFFSDTGFFNLLGGATITTSDIGSSETLFLLASVDYPAASYPSVTVNFPSYQFATSASLNLDGASVATLSNSTTVYVINQNTLKLSVGVHTLTAVVNGQVTSTFSFYVIAAPAWMSSIRSDAGAVLGSGKGLTVSNSFPKNNIFPAIVMQGDTKFTLSPTLTGKVDYSYPLNGLVSAGFAAYVGFPPTTMSDADNSVKLSTNLQTSVTGTVPTLNLNGVTATKSFTSSLSAISYTKDMGFLGTLTVSVPFVFSTSINLNAQPNTGFDIGYGLKTTGTLNILGDMDISPSNFIAQGSFSVSGLQKTTNINLAFDYSTADLLTASTFFANVSGTVVSSGALKVTLYSGALATITCTKSAQNLTAVTMNCNVYSLANVDSSVILAAFNVPAAVPAFTPDPSVTSPPVPPFKPPGSRPRSLEEEVAPLPFYSRDWAQVPFASSKKRDIVGSSGILVSDVYEGSTTDGIKFASIDTSSLAVWVGFDKTRPAPFGYNIQYSAFNATGKSWTNPASIDPSITVAGSPSVTGVAGTSKFVAAWESQNLPSGTSVTIEQALNTTEVYAGLYLADTKKWTITKLTSNNIYDGMPTVCSTTFNNAQLVAVAWQQGNFLKPQDIVVAIGVVGTDIGATGTWTQPVTVATGIKTLSSLSCSWSVDTVAITYTQVSGANPAKVSMSLFVNENDTVTPVIPTIVDGTPDTAPVTTITSNGQFLSAWIHGSKILVQSTLLDGSSGGSPITITLSSQPSLVSLSATANYVVLTYYQTVGSVGTFFMRTLASGDTAFSAATAILKLNQNEGAIQAQSQLIENASGRQLLLVYSSTVSGSITSHHYALIDLKPILQVKSVAFTANQDGTINVDLAIVNVGTWSLQSSEKTAFIYDGDASGAKTQLGAAALPSIAVNSVYENTITVALSSSAQGYVWVEITVPSDTYLDYASHYGYPVYTPTIANLAISALPTGGIQISASVGANSLFKCSTVVVPCTLSTLDPTTSAYTTLATTTVSVPCGSSSFVQIDAAENQIKGTLKLVSGTPIDASATVPFATSASSILPVSPYADIVIAPGAISVDSPFIGDAQLFAVVQNTAIFSASNVVVNVYINSASATTPDTTGTLVGTTTIAQLSAQSSITVAISLASINNTGNYTLGVLANPARTIPEANYVNDGGMIKVSLSKNAWVQIAATAIRVTANSVQIAVTNAGAAKLDAGLVTISVGGVSLGSVNVSNVLPKYCSIASVSSSTDLLADPTAAVVVTIPSPLSGSFNPTTVTTTVSAASTSTLPTCGDVPVNAPPGLAADSLVAIVGIPKTIVISGTSVSPFLAPLLSFNITNLPSNASKIDPCANATNTGVLCKKEAFTFTAKLSDIPSGQISTTREISTALYTTSNNNTLAATKFNITITSCGNLIVDNPAEQCDGGANCTVLCQFVKNNSTGATQAPTTAASSSGTPTTAPVTEKKSNHNRKLALGLGLGLGLFLPLIVIGAVVVYVFVIKKGGGIGRRAIEMDPR